MADPEQPEVRAELERKAARGGDKSPKDNTAPSEAAEDEDDEAE